MSYDLDDDSNDQGPKALRDALEKANKKLAELEKQNADLAKKANEGTLSQIFTAKKVPANIQRWMKRDEVEASPEAVDKWLEENGSDFGWNPQAASAETPEGQQTEAKEAPAAQSVLTPEDVAALQRGQQLSAAASGQHLLSDQADQAVATAAQVLTGGRDDLDKLMAAFKEQGIPVESSFG